MTLDKWKCEVDRLMKAFYAIDSCDAGLDDDELQTYAISLPEPADFVSWFADKYDLTPIKG